MATMNQWNWVALSLTALVFTACARQQPPQSAAGPHSAHAETAARTECSMAGKSMEAGAPREAHKCSEHCRMMSKHESKADAPATNETQTSNAP